MGGALEFQYASNFRIATYVNPPLGMAGESVPHPGGPTQPKLATPDEKREHISFHRKETPGPRNTELTQSCCYHSRNMLLLTASWPCSCGRPWLRLGETQNKNKTK